MSKRQRSGRSSFSQPHPFYGKPTEMYPNGHHNGQSNYLKNAALLYDVAMPVARAILDHASHLGAEKGMLTLNRFFFSVSIERGGI